jgi:hypothetical protein
MFNPAIDRIRHRSSGHLHWLAGGDSNRLGFCIAWLRFAVFTPFFRVVLIGRNGVSVSRTVINEFISVLLVVRAADINRIFRTARIRLRLRVMKSPCRSARPQAAGTLI